MNGLKTNKEAKICAWCDKEGRKYQEMGYPVEAVDAVLKRGFDYILLAVMDERTAEEIRRELVIQGVEEQQILWLDVRQLEEVDFLFIR